VGRELSERGKIALRERKIALRERKIFTQRSNNQYK
jgi:hypothetical protein